MKYSFNDNFLNYYEDYASYSNMGLAVFNDEGYFLAANGEFIEICKLNEETITDINVRICFKNNEDIIKFANDGFKGSKSFRVDFEDKESYIYACFSNIHHSEDSVCRFVTVSNKSREVQIISEMANNLSQIRALIDEAETGFVILDENHTIIEANRIFSNYLGYTREEVIGLTAWDYVHNFSNKFEIKNFDPLDTFKFEDDNYHIKKNGELIPVKAVCSVGILNGKQIAICFYNNITAEKESQRIIQESETMLQNIISKSDDVIFILKDNLEVDYMSHNAKRIFKLTRKISEEQLIKKYLPLNDPNFIDFVRKYQKNKSKYAEQEFEYSISSKNNVTRYYSVRISETKKPKMLICYAKDITKDKNYIEELKLLSYTDQLTTLYNRKFMEEQLLLLSNKASLPISIISADLDGLKEVNDSLGHQAGDELLRIFANMLIDTSVSNECIFRIGGDEFLVISPNTNENEIKRVIEDIENAITVHNSTPGSLLKISVSIGSATSHSFTTSLPSLLAMADKEMYTVKNARKSKKKTA